MAETSNIAQIAETVSKDIFEVMGWHRNTIPNTNWNCVEPKKHACRTHPCDAVWYYDEPYRHQRTYILSDLKSYQAKSIQPSSLAPAIVSLSKAVECAKKSDEWQQRFLINRATPFDVVGMLFIYNHDRDFDKSFEGVLPDLTIPNTPGYSNGVRVMVMGPRLIWELNSIANDLKQLRYRSNGSVMMVHSPFYPECRRNQYRTRDIERSAATIDSLFSNILAFKTKTVGDQYGYRQLHVYYRGKGNTSEEFLSLLDYCFRYQQIDNAEKIVVHFSNFNQSDNTKASENWEKAKHEFREAFDFSADRLEIMKCESLQLVIPRWCATEIGMRN